MAGIGVCRFKCKWLGGIMQIQNWITLLSDSWGNSSSNHLDFNQWNQHITPFLVNSHILGVGRRCVKELSKSDFFHNKSPLNCRASYRFHSQDFPHYRCKGWAWLLPEVCRRSDPHSGGPPLTPDRYYRRVWCWMEERKQSATCSHLVLCLHQLQTPSTTLQYLEYFVLTATWWVFGWGWRSPGPRPGEGVSCLWRSWSGLNVWTWPSKLCSSSSRRPPPLGSRRSCSPASGQIHTHMNKTVRRYWLL